MKPRTALIFLALAAAPLAACDDGYGYGRGSLYWSDYPYNGWYDGYYGSIYDGYWGTDNFFYYRLGPSERNYRRADRDHFRRGDMPQGGNYHRFEGTTHQPPQGTHMPRFPREGGHGGRRP